MLSQRQYIIDMLERYGFSDCASVKTPMDPGKRLSAVKDALSPKDKAFMQQVPYLSAVGSLMYLATCTRPDIAYTVSVLLASMRILRRCTGRLSSICSGISRGLWTCS